MRRTHSTALTATLLIVGLCGVAAIAPVLSDETPASTAISMSETIPFAEDAAGDVGIMAPAGGMANSIEEKCDLQRLLAEAIVERAKRKGIEIVRTPHPEAATGRVLRIVVEGVLGMQGGAWTGTKSMTLRGELREGDQVIASFVAREQQTALFMNTCDALIDCGGKIAAHIAKWLAKPVMKARLGSA